MHTFFAMGGYAIYVWPAYAIVSLLLILNVAVTRVKRRKIMRQLRDYYETSA